MANVSQREHLVRVLNAAGCTVGVGVFVGPQHIVTCAHVVNLALGLDLRSQAQPAGAVALSLATAGSGTPAIAQAQVQCWLPPPTVNTAGDDIAGLVLLHTDPPGAILPVGTRPAQIAINLPAPGTVVDVFGYPGDPPRPDGSWVEAIIRGQVGGGRVQVDSTADTALRIQPGYSGSPVIDRGTGRVVGLLAAAPDTGSPERDSYAISAEQLRLAWPQVLDRRRTRPRTHPYRSRTDPASELTILHVSDLQFGAKHLFGGNGLTPADQAHDTLFQRLHDDLDDLGREHQLRPDLMVVTGDLAETGMPAEFEQVLRFLTTLTEAVGLPREHVAIVPGNHDVNWKSCQAYFLQEPDQFNACMIDQPVHAV